MRVVVAAVCLLMTLGAAFADQRILPPVKKSEWERALSVGGVARKYTMFRPADGGAQALPLLIVFHGGGQDGAAAARYTRFDESYIQARFVVVYPEGVGRNWNDGRVSPDLAERASASVDDVAFAAQIIDALSDEGLVDKTRVFVTGASNGGMMALKVACDLGQRIAGVAAVVANLPADWECRAKRMPALFINGTDDEYMPFAGGAVAATKQRLDLGSVRSVDETIAVFKRMNGCSGVQQTNSLDKVERDKTVAVITDYTCSRAPLRQIVIQGGGHTWPGARTGIIAGWVLGNTSEEVNATEEIWAFFKALPAP